MIKAIVFDHGGVIIRYSKEMLLRDISVFMKVNIKKITKAYKIVRPDFLQGKINEKKFWDRLTKPIGMNITQVKWKNFLKDEFRKRAGVNKKMEKFVVSLKKSGYKIALLSNTIKPHVEYAKEKGWYEIFPIKVLSCEVGYAKPDKKIYFLILKRLKVRPEETVFIDNQKENLKKARELGINTIKFRNINQLKKDLLRYGVHGL